MWSSPPAQLGLGCCLPKLVTAVLTIGVTFTAVACGQAPGLTTDPSPTTVPVSTQSASGPGTSDDDSNREACIRAGWGSGTAYRFLDQLDPDDDFNFEDAVFQVNSLTGTLFDMKLRSRGELRDLAATAYAVLDDLRDDLDAGESFDPEPALVMLDEIAAFCVAIGVDNPFNDSRY